MYINHDIRFALVAAGILAPSALGKPIPAPGFFDSIKDKVGGVLDGVGDAIEGVTGDINDFLKSIGDIPLVDDVLDKAGLSDPPQPFDASLLPNIEYFAEFASAAYCDPNHVPGEQVVCPEGFCPKVTINNVFTVAEFQDQGSSDTSGIVARDDDTRNIVVSYRGSQSIRNFFTDVRISLTDVPEICEGCKAHTGFLDAHKEEFPTVLNAVNQLRQENPDYGVVVTGHSLGGAIGALAATELRRLGMQVTLYSFGAPRVGNKELSEFITNDGLNFRVTHLDDPVPKLPPLAVGYEHISPEYHIFTGDVGIRAEDIRVLTGTINFNGNSGAEPLGFNTSAHRHYFVNGEFSGCGELGDGGIEFRI